MQAVMNDLIDIVKCVLCNWETRFLEFQDILMCTCVSGKKHDEPTHVDYVPSLFVYRCTKPRNAERFERCLQRRLQANRSLALTARDEETTDAAAVLCSLSSGPPKLQSKGDVLFYAVYLIL